MDWDAIFSGMFSDSRFTHRSRLAFANVNGIRIGTVLATFNPSWGTHALNKGDLDRLMAGKRDGKLDEAFVIMVKVNGKDITVSGWRYAEELNQELQKHEPILGKFGPFWPINSAGNDLPF